MKILKILGAGLLAGAAAACGSGGGSGALAPPALTPPVDPGDLASCPQESWIGGTVEIRDGVLTYLDYVYDDHGADTDPTFNAPIGSLSPVAGDATYADDPDTAENDLNTADLVKLFVAVDGDELVVTAELNTLYAADSTLLGVVIDTDNDPATGKATADPWKSDGHELDAGSIGWETIRIFAAGDPETNLITGRIPKPATPVWRIQAAVAQADGTIMNVAFRGTAEESKGLTADGPTAGTFFEDLQAAALADEDISAFGQVVTAADLVAGTNKTLTAVTPGLHERVYTSCFTLSPDGTIGVNGVPQTFEGISVAGVPGRHGDTGGTCEQYFHFLGKYQPYGIYLPGAGGPHGVQLAMHGCEANHSSLINNAGMQTQFGEDLNRILVVPLGRGPTGFNSDISERDVIDVIADVLASYDVDKDKLVSGGYSMGGYGTLRFATLYPHWFAGAVNWVGFTGDVFNTPAPGNPGAGPECPGGECPTGGSSSGAVGNVIDFVGNLLHVPSAHLYAGQDELVHASTGIAMRQALQAATDVPHIFYFHPAAEHLTFALLDDWAKEATRSKDWVRVPNPARVRYRTDAALDYPEYAIRHDRAYWVSDITARDAGYSDVDVTTFACGTEVPTYAAIANGGGVGPGPLVYQSAERNANGATRPAEANKLTATLVNVAELTLDVTATCLESGAVSYDVTTDGPVTIRLSDGRSVTLAETGTGSF